MRFNAMWQQEYSNYNEVNMYTIAISIHIKIHKELCTD